MMFGWLSFCALFASRRNRSRMTGSAAYCGRQDLHGAQPVDELVARAVDGRHPPFADDLLEHVAPGEERADPRVLERDEIGPFDEAELRLVRVAHLALRARLQVLPASASFGQRFRKSPNARSGRTVTRPPWDPQFTLVRPEVWNIAMGYDVGQRAQ